MWGKIHIFHSGKDTFYRDTKFRMKNVYMNDYFCSSSFGIILMSFSVRVPTVWRRYILNECGYPTGQQLISSTLDGCFFFVCVKKPHTISYSLLYLILAVLLLEV